MRSNVYLVGAGSSWALIDTGGRACAVSIRTAADVVFGADVPAAAIVLTHHHPDHSGSARELARVWRCPVYFHADELPLTSGEIAALGRYANPLDRWLILPLLRILPPSRREAMLAEGSLSDVAVALDPDGEPPGLPGWLCVPTPGHTPGHVAFFRPSDRVLITGDAIVTVNLNSPVGLLQRPRPCPPPRYSTWNWRQATDSAAALALLEPRVLAGGHGPPLAGPVLAAGLHALADGLDDAGAHETSRRARPAGQPRHGPLAPMPAPEKKRSRIGHAVLGLSAIGYPLTQATIRRFGVRGAVVVEAACVGLLIRDGFLLAAGTPRRLRHLPAALLWLETGVAAAAVAAGIRPLLAPAALERAARKHSSGSETIRRSAIRILFALHTLRFRIYLQPDRGRRPASP